MAQAGTLPAPKVDPASGITLSLRCPFAEPPLAGTVPVELTVRNDGPRSARFELVFLSGMPYWEEIESHHSVAVERGAARTFHFVVPLSRSQSWISVRLRMRGPGLDSEEVQLYQRHLAVGGAGNPGSESAPFAMSESLAVGAWETINAELLAAGLANAGSRFLPATLPTDARAYAGFQLLFLTDQEQAALAADALLGVMDWVALGGRLVLVGAERPERRHGFGVVSSLPAPAASERLARELIEAGAPQGLARRFGFEKAGDWPLPNRLPAPELARGRLFLFLLLVALAMGPVNLFALARGLHRHRIYWTTPVLSLVASLALFGLILVQDGTGGWGLRFTAIAVIPGVNRAAVIQEQVARTGLLLGERWTSAEPLRVDTLPTERGPQVSFSGSAGRRVVHVGDLHRGLFRSRSREAQYLEALRPTRAGVLISHSAAPEAVSSMGATLDDLFFVDDQGQAWHARGVKAGVRARLARSGDLGRWWDERLSLAGPAGRSRLGPLKARPGYFYASALSGGAIETLPSIRWRQEALLYLGPAEVRP